MARALTARKTLLIDIAFALAAALSLVLCIGLARVWQTVAVAKGADTDAVVLTSELRVPDGDAIAYVRGGWRREDADAVVARLGPSLKVGLVAVRDVVAEIASRRVALWVVVMDPITFSIVMPEAVCRDTDVILDGRDLRLWNGVESLLIDGRSQRTRAADLLRLRVLLRRHDRPLALVCSDEKNGGSIPMIVAAGPSASAIAQAIAADSSLFRDGLFGNRLVQAPLGASLAGSVAQRFAWLGPATSVALLACFLLFAAWGSIRGLKERDELRLRRVLGATPAQLRLLSLSRIAAPVAIALTGGMGVGAWLDLGAVGAGDAKPPAATMLLWIALASMASAWLARAVTGLSGIERALNANGASTAFTVKLWPYLVAWSLCLALVVVCAGVYVDLGNHLSRVQALELGYEPAGMLSITVTVPGAATSEDSLWRMQLDVLASAQSITGPDSASLICNAPWAFDSTRELSDSLGTTNAGVMIGGGPQLLRLMQVTNRTGRDFVLSDMTGAPAAINQNQGSKRSAQLDKAFRPVGEIGNVHLGSLNPIAREFLLVSITKVNCSEFEVLLRLPHAGIQQARAVASSLQLRFPQLAIGEAIEVSEIIGRQRAPISRMVQLVTAAGATGMSLLTALGAAFIGAYFSAQRRELAIRQALGESALRSALGVTMQLLRWAMPGMLLALLTYLACLSALRALVLDFRASNMVSVLSISFCIIAGALTLMAVFVYRRSVTLPLRSALVE